MKSYQLLAILGTLLLIAFLFFASSVANSESDILEFYFPLLGIPGLLLLGTAVGLKRKTKNASSQMNHNPISNEKNQVPEEKTIQLEVPDHCPHCKNPNTKKIRLCEWCGNQIY